MTAENKLVSIGLDALRSQARASVQIDRCIEKLTDRELAVVTSLAERSLLQNPGYRHGQQVVSALRELAEARKQLAAAAEDKALLDHNSIELMNCMDGEWKPCVFEQVDLRDGIRKAIARDGMGSLEKGGAS